MVYLRQLTSHKKTNSPAAPPQKSTPPATENAHVTTMISILADAGCTLCNSSAPPLLPTDLHKLQRHLEIRFSSEPSLIPTFLSGFSSFIQNPKNLHKLLISEPPSSSSNNSLVRILLLVRPLQLQIQRMLIEKLPEFFNTDNASLKDDVARLILKQFRWLDFMVDSKSFTEKLLEVLSICPVQLKKEIIGSLPEIIGDQNNETVVTALEQMLQEDSEIIVPVLDTFSNLNQEDQLQEQVVTIALSCIRTVNAEHLPDVLRFLLLSATPSNVRRIISQIREHLKFVDISESRASRQRKRKGKSLADNTEASILEALRSSLRFKNILCEAVLKELKSLDKASDHKIIDVWLLLLIYANGGSLQKIAEKIMRKKIVERCFVESLFGQCIRGHKELVKDYFSSFLSISESLLACKEHIAREFGIYMYTTLFEEFLDTYFRQEVLGSLVTHIGSGISYEVSSALECMILLTSKYSQELIPVSSYISGILDYLEGFNDEHLHKVYEVFSHLALSARSNADSVGSSIANELLMIVRKQVANPDLKYKKMGIIGTLKIVSCLGNLNAVTSFSPSQKSNSEEALELLKMSLDSCKSLPIAFILFYDELVMLLECTALQPRIMEWMCKHVGEFESMFLFDLEGGKLPVKINECSGLEGELWMNLDGDRSPIYLNILSLLSSSPHKSSSLQFLPAYFLLLSAVERLTNQGSLGGIDALLGCPLQLPSSKYFFGAAWNNLTGMQKQIVGLSLYYAINWIRELLNAFCTQVAGESDCMTQATKEEMIVKLLMRLRNLVFLESLLNAFLKLFPFSLPGLNSFFGHSGSSFLRQPDTFMRNEYKGEKRKTSEGTLPKSRKKCKKGMSNPEKLDVNGKLKQPTILDSFKKAGVAISQQMPSEGCSMMSSKGKTLQEEERQSVQSNEQGFFISICAVPDVLNTQIFKFRPLHVDCLSVLTFSQSQETCCSDPAAELLLHLYLLRDFHYKLDYLSPPSKHSPAASSPVHKAPPGLHGITTNEFLSRIKLLFPSLRKLFERAVCILKEEGSETCEDHWRAEFASAGNPDIPHLAVSKSLVASSVFMEILRCCGKVLNLPDIYIPMNMPILKSLLEAFQPKQIPDNMFSAIQPFPSPGNLDYLYCSAYSFLESLMDTAGLLSFSLASEVLVTLESLVNSIRIFVDKLLEGNGKYLCGGFVQGIHPFLCRRLGASAHKLLAHDWDCQDRDKSWKNQGDLIQTILHIYLKNNESTLDLLDELACKILPQVPSHKTRTGQDHVDGFPTLCPAMLVTWYRVLHEENLVNLSKLIKEAVVLQRSKTDVTQEAVKGLLAKTQQSVNVVVSLVNVCKIHDKVAVHAMVVKYGGRFVDSFLKVFDFLRVHFEVHNDTIIQLVKELQKATRTIQTLCSEAKGSKRTIITSKIPATKRSMERFLFHVKGLLHSTSNGCSFWMGNLKHKDLFGQVVSSQVYANEEEEATDIQGEGDVDEQDAVNAQGCEETS